MPFLVIQNAHAPATPNLGPALAPDALFLLLRVPLSHDVLRDASIEIQFLA
jgi:hypothetical protein